MIQIDMPTPENCVECRFSQGGYMYCHAMPENFCGYVNYCEENGRPEWCPLIAQEPRVMTLEELAAAQKTPVWRETKSKHKDLYNGWMLAYDIQWGKGIMGMRQGMTEPNGRVGWCKLDDYGKTWRCWTAKPTEEQREAVKWYE